MNFLGNNEALKSARRLRRKIERNPIRRSRDFTSVPVTAKPALSISAKRDQKFRQDFGIDSEEIVLKVSRIWDQ